MGKQVNPQILRFSQNEDWLSKYYCDNFNYSNLIMQDNIILKLLKFIFIAKKMGLLLGFFHIMIHLLIGNHF